VGASCDLDSAFSHAEIHHMAEERNKTAHYSGGKTAGRRNIRLSEVKLATQRKCQYVVQSCDNSIRHHQHFTLLLTDPLRLLVSYIN